MKPLIVIFLFVLLFSLLTVWEIILLKKAGFDIVAHLRVTYETAKKIKLFFEAFGVIAFVLIQPFVLTAIVVWAFGEVQPLLDGIALIATAF